MPDYPSIFSRLCSKDNFEARKVVGSIPLCRDLK